MNEDEPKETTVSFQEAKVPENTCSNMVQRRKNACDLWICNYTWSKTSPNKKYILSLNTFRVYYHLAIIQNYYSKSEHVVSIIMFKCNPALINQFTNMPVSYTCFQGYTGNWDWPVSPVPGHAYKTLSCTPWMTSTQRVLVRRQTGLVKRDFLTVHQCGGPLRFVLLCPIASTRLSLFTIH